MDCSKQKHLTMNVYIIEYDFMGTPRKLEATSWEELLGMLEGLDHNQYVLNSTIVINTVKR